MEWFSDAILDHMIRQKMREILQIREKFYEQET